MMAENKAQTAVEVQVSDPQTEGEGRNKHTMYLVETLGKHASSVRRRYSDFQWLYAKLLEEVPGAIIPIIPHKQAVRESVRFSDELTQERCAQLDSFLKRVCSHAELQESASLKLFMTAFNEEWEKVRMENGEENSEHGAGGAGGPDTPSNKIGSFFNKARAKISIATGTEMEKTPEDAVFAALDEYISNMDLQLKAMAKDAIAMNKATKEQASTMENMGAAFMNLAEKRYPQAYNDDLSYLFSELSEEIAAIANLSVKFEKKEETDFAEPMQELAREVQAAKLALTQRKEILWDYTRKVAVAKTKKAQFEKGKAAVDDVEAVKKESLALWKSVEVVSKRLQREMDSFRAVFEDKLRLCMSNYATLCMEYSQQVEKGWSSILPIVNLVNAEGKNKSEGPPSQAFQAQHAPPPAGAPPVPVQDDVAALTLEESDTKEETVDFNEPSGDDEAQVDVI